MTYTQAQNFNAFTEAFECLANTNEMIADYYISHYWDDDNQEWDFELITDRVVKDIETDVMMIAGV
jgi:hypothetical protein